MFDRIKGKFTLAVLLLYLFLRQYGEWVLVSDVLAVIALIMVIRRNIWRE